MEKRLICGPFRPTLESALASIVAGKGKDPLSPVLVLVGSHLLARYLERMLATELGGQANTRILTLHDFCSRLASGPHSGKPSAPRVLKEGVTATLVDRSDPSFGAVANRPGFHAALVDTFEALELAGFNPEMDPPGNTSEKVKRVFELYHAFRERFDDLYTSSGQLIARATANANSVADLFGPNHIFAYGFYDLNGAQRGLFAALSDANDLVFLVPYAATEAGGAAAMEYVEPFIQWLYGQGFEAAVEPSEKPADAISRLSLVQEWFNPRSHSGLEDGTVSFISAPSRAAEVREIAREILLAAKGGVMFQDMAVILHSSTTYLPLIREIFESCGIPFYCNSERTVAECQEGKSLLLLAAVPGSDYSRSAVMDFLSHARLDPKVVIEKDSFAFKPQAWNHVACEAMIVGGSGQWEERFATYLEQGDTDTETEERTGLPDWKRKAAGEALRVFITLKESLEGFPKEGTIGEFVTPLLRTYERFTADDEEGPRSTVIEALKELQDIGGDLGPFTAESFMRMLEEHLRGSSVPRGKYLSGGVNVIDDMEARGTGYDLVFIPGLVEKSFPAQVSEDPVLLDFERKSLSHDSGFFLPLKMERLKEERLLFTLDTWLAKERLVLSYPRLEELGTRRRIPSVFLLRAVEACSGRRLTFQQLTSVKGFCTVHMLNGQGVSPADAISEGEFRLASIADGKRPAVVGSLRESEEFKRAESMLASRRSYGEYDSFDGMLGDLGKQYLDTDPVFSPTGLELYTQCPYHFLNYRILRTESVEEPEDLLTISPLELGVIVHEIMAEFLEECRSLGNSSLDASTCRSIMEKVSTDNFDIAVARGVTGQPLSWKRKRAEVEQVLLRLAEERSQEEPDRETKLVEHQFGYDEHVFIEDEIGQPLLRIRGKADRVDTINGGNGLHVIDYKTGKVKQKVPKEDRDVFIPKNKKYLGLYFQAIVYLVGAWALLESRDWDPQKAELYHIFQDEEPRRVTYGGDKERFELHYGWLVKITRAIKDLIESGVFVYRPSDHCKFCDYRATCPAERGPISSRKEDKAIKQEGSDIARLINLLAELQKGGLLDG